MRKIGSLSNQTLGISSEHNIAYNAKETFLGISHTIKANFNPSTMQVSVGESITGPLGTTSFKLTSDGSIEAELTPSGNVQTFEKLGWLFQTELGYKISGSYREVDAEPSGGSWLDRTVEDLRIAADTAFAAVVVYMTAPVSIPLGIGYATLEAS